LLASTLAALPLPGDMETEPRIVRFSSSPEDFEQASADVRDAVAQTGAGESARRRADVVFEELVSNVIRHGRVGRTGQIQVTVALDADALVLTFEDDGLPFDPVDHPQPAQRRSLEETPDGGLGLLLVRKASTRLQYERTPEATNRLVVTIARA
jgi:serine/threonine-protein kinase RsbW